MAAILCGGCTKACSGLCECIGSVCKAPFQLCDICCKGMADCCRGACDVVWGCCTSPFCCYITIALLFNIPCVALGIADLATGGLGSGCRASIWLLVFWILSLIHIVAAFYMSYAIQQDDSILGSIDEENPASRNLRRGGDRMKHLFCYDGWMAVYILIVFGYWIWMILGTIWLIQMSFESSMDDACDDKYTGYATAFGLGWAFLFWGTCALCCSLCCNACLNKEGTTNNNNNNNNNTSPASNAAAAPASATVQGSAKMESGKQTPTSTTSSSTKIPTPTAPPADADIPMATAEPVFDSSTKKMDSGIKPTVY